MGYCDVTSKRALSALGGEERNRIINLFCCGARSAIPPSRLSYVDSDDPENSDVRLELKTKWSDGTRALEFKQVDLVEGLADIVPESWSNLTRHHGVFFPRHAWLGFIVPGRRRLSRLLSMETEMREAQASDGEATTKNPSSGRTPAFVTQSNAKGLLLLLGGDPSQGSG